MKKIQVMLLSLVAMLLSMTVAVTAADGGWTVNKVGDFTSESKAELVSKYRYDGDHSMSIVNKETTLVDGRYIEIENKLSSPVEEGKYTLTFYVKKGSSSTAVSAVIGDTEISGSDMTITAATAPSGESSWKEYKTEFNYTGDSARVMSLRSYSMSATQYIDNVSLVKDGTTANLVTDSGFEDSESSSATPTPTVKPDSTPNPDATPEPGSTPSPVVTPEPIVTVDYQPTKVMLSPGNKFFGLSYINPSHSGITKVSLYDITSGGETLVTDGLSTESSARVDYKIEGLTAGGKYQYKLVFSYSNRADFVYYIGGQLSDLSPFSGEDWEVEFFRGGTAGYCPVEIEVVNTEHAEGTHSLKIVSNIDQNIKQFQGNIYLNLKQNMPMESENKYKFFLKIKGQNVAWAPALHMSWSSFDSKKFSSGYGTGTYDWVTVEMVYSKGEKTKFMLNLENTCDAMYVDDFQCYLLDENGNITGENLFKNGGFEDVVKDESAELVDFGAQAGIGKIDLSWENPASNHIYTNVYRKVSGGRVLLGRLSPGVTSLCMDDLEEDEQYTFSVVPVGTDGQEGVENLVDMKTLIRDYVVEEPVLKKGSTVVDKLSGAGDYSVTVQACNNTVTAGVKCEVIVAVYDGNTLVNVYSQKADLPLDRKKNKDITTPFTLPEGENYRIKTFVIDERDSFEYYYAPVDYGM